MFTGGAGSGKAPHCFWFRDLCKTSWSVGVDRGEMQLAGGACPPQSQRLLFIKSFPHGVELRRRRQEDSELQANLDYLVRFETLRSI